jgi:16S rRNA (guanine(966)-N(2))-methyltransferase RsmD
VSLKIIAGEMRGRVLKTPHRDGLFVRPMLGRVKKSVFDIIRLKIPNSIFVDLFAGTGSVGLEALSRGAKKVVFVESSETSISFIKRNICMLGLNDKSKIIRCDIIREFFSLHGKFDIVFMAPPYKNRFNKKALALTYPTLGNVVKYDILKHDSLIISQRHTKEAVGNIAKLECFRSEKYGDTVISFYKLGMGNRK